jgi:TPR repeat protein/tRNA A-37 threonylcarbamoyl transferase component Bud32
MSTNSQDVKVSLEVKAQREVLGQRDFSHIKWSDLNYVLESGIPKILGKGGFGVVYLGTYRQGKGYVAIKELSIDSANDKAVLEFENEATVMQKCRSDFLVKYYGYCLQPRYCLVMEYMSGGSLLNFLQSYKNKPLDWKVRYRISMEMSLGLQYLHENGILHRDIKSLNVLIDETGHAKLSDFGQSKEADICRAKSVVGTPAWRAPELCEKGIEKCTEKSDIYSLGMTFWEIAFKKTPFRKYSREEVLSLVAKGMREEKPKEVPGDPESCPSRFSSLIFSCWKGTGWMADKCWLGEPSDRPTAKQIADYLHPINENEDDFEAFIAQEDARAQLKCGDRFQESADYIRAVKYYQRAVHKAVDKNDKYSAGIGYYNLALLCEGNRFPGKGSVDALGYYNEAAKFGHANAQYKISLYYLNLKNYKQALEYFELAANNGNKNSQLYLGGLHENGSQDWGLKKDLKKALKYYDCAVNNRSIDVKENLDKLAEESLERCVFSINNLGYDYYNSKDIAENRKAIEYFVLAAGYKCQIAQFNLGICYQYAKGGAQKDLKEALKYYKFALDQSHENAQQAFQSCAAELNALGCDYYNTEDPEKNKKAFEYFIFLAEFKEPYAQFNVGLCYEYGKGVAEKNPKEALKYYKLAVDQGHQEAQEGLKRCADVLYRFGFEHYTIKEAGEHQKAFGFFKLAAEYGHLEAQFYLGVCYEHGKGGAEKNLLEALQWYRCAAEKQHPAALNSLGSHHYNLKNAEEYKKAFEYFKAAANHKYLLAQYNLGLCYEFGRGTEKDLGQAEACYKEAADRGHSSAQYKRGLHYYNSKDAAEKKKGFEYFRSVAEQKHLNGQFYLGCCYENGIGTEINLEEAVKYYKMAEARGHKNAKEGLTRCMERQYKLGLECKAKGNFEEMVNRFKAAAELNHPEANYQLGVYYIDKKEYKKGISYYEHAQELGHLRAESMVKFLQSQTGGYTSTPANLPKRENRKRKRSNAP